MHRRSRAPGRCCLLLAACAGAPHSVQPAPAPWPEADALFRRDPHWLGGDAVYSVALGGDRILWLFGDSFVALDGRGDRRTATMVRNTIALQAGRDPATATLAFHWRTEGGRAAPFFADAGPVGHWPLHGCRLDGGPLLLFQTRVRNTTGQGLGFAIDGFRLLRVGDVDAPPRAWQPRELAIDGAPPGITFGVAVWRDGEHLLVLGTRGDGPHRGVLGRMALGELADPACERVRLECWLGDRWGAAAGGAPAVVLDEAGPECSVDVLGDRLAHVYSRGFGATSVALHMATRAMGPWSASRDLFVPPESGGARPFVYAAKAHPELAAGPGQLAVSYATNAFDFGELFTAAGQRSLYWPRFWRVAAP